MEGDLIIEGEPAEAPEPPAPAEVADAAVTVIEAQAEADVLRIEAEAQAAVARTEAVGDLAEDVLRTELDQCRTALEASSIENRRLTEENLDLRSSILELEARLSQPEPNPNPDESGDGEVTPVSPEAAEPVPEPPKVRPKHRWI